MPPPWTVNRWSTTEREREHRGDCTRFHGYFPRPPETCIEKKEPDQAGLLPHDLNSG